MVGIVMGWRWMVGWGVLGNGMSRQYCSGCVYCRLGSQNGPSSSFGSTDEVPFGSLFILWNFKSFLLPFFFFKFSSVLRPIRFLMIQTWTKMKRLTFPPSFICNRQTKILKKHRPTCVLFVCLFFGFDRDFCCMIHLQGRKETDPRRPEMYF